MHLKNVAVAAVFAMLLSVFSAFAGEKPLPFNPGQIQSVNEMSIEMEGGPVRLSETHLEVSASQVGEIVAAIPAEKSVLISTDSEAVVSETFNNKALNQAKITKVQFIPLGDLDKKIKNETFFNKLKTYKSNIVRSAKEDRIGLVILSINTAYDSYIWLHATEYSPEVRAAQIIFTTALSVAFSIDKDAWARTAGHIKDRIYKAFNIATDSFWMDLTGRFASNLALGLAVQSLRVSILAVDKVVALPDLIGLAGSSVLLSLGFTFSGFGWTEFANKINSTTHPRAKFIARRMSEIRSLLMGHLAPSGKLLQADTYGYAPWIALSVHGIIGVVTFWKGGPIMDWLERKFTKISSTNSCDRIL
ncbi:MAG: hypothetical protein AAGB31_15580 [Bdellovibrio sp.]